MRHRPPQFAKTLRIAAATCAAVSITAIRAFGAEEESLPFDYVDKVSVLEVAADLSRRTEADALATAAMLYDSVNDQAAALDRARRAARLAPERADLAWLELQLCTQNTACATDAPARRLVTLDPLNGATFLHELDEAGDPARARFDRALLRISQAERIDIYWNRLVVAATDVLARSDFAVDDGSPDFSYSAVTHAVGMVVAGALPNFNRITTACSMERIEDSTRRDLCLRIARSLQRGDTLLAEALGMAMEKRSWPLGSAEAAAAHERRESLRSWQDEQRKLEASDAEWSPRMIAALRTHRTEREAGDAVLAQYRVSGHTASAERSMPGAAARNPLTSDAAFDRDSVPNLAQRPGRMTMPIELLNVNFLAVLVAALSSFMLGGLWYSRALFGVLWSREAGVSPDTQGHRPMVFVTSYLLAFIAAWLFAALLPADISVAQATLLGALIGIAWVATSFGINYGFGDRSLTLWLIDAGYHTLQFTLYGAILGAWK